MARREAMPVEVALAAVLVSLPALAARAAVVRAPALAPGLGVSATAAILPAVAPLLPVPVAPQFSAHALAAPSAELAPFAAIPAPAASALAPLRAAAEGPPPVAAPSGAAPSSESESARAGASFDGSAALPPSAAAEVPVYEPGDGLRAVDPDDAAWLASAVAALARSRTGRRVLREIAELERRRGHPTLVVVKRISNNGEFRYDSDLLVMDTGHRRRPPEETAPILAHELQHVLQRSLGLPADTLELEVESYAVESRVWSELGLEPPPRSFARDARRHLTTDLDGFLKWLGKEYKGNRLLHGGTTDAYVEWLEGEKAKGARSLKRAERDLAAALRVVAAMRAEGKPEEAVRAHAREDVEPAEARARDARRSIEWAERDLALLASPEGRARFRRWSQGVIRRARALSR